MQEPQIERENQDYLQLGRSVRKIESIQEKKEDTRLR